MRERKRSSGRSHSSRSHMTSRSVSGGSIVSDIQDKYAAPSSGDSYVSESTWNTTTEPRVGIQEEVQAFELLAKSYQSKLSTLVEDYQGKLETIESPDARDEIEEFRNAEDKIIQNRDRVSQGDGRGKGSNVKVNIIRQSQATRGHLTGNTTDKTKASFWNKGQSKVMAKSNIVSKPRGNESLYTC